MAYTYSWSHKNAIKTTIENKTSGCLIQFGNLSLRRKSPHRLQIVMEGSLEVKLPTYGQMKRQRWEESEKRREKKRREEKRKRKKIREEKESEERISKRAKR